MYISSTVRFSKNWELENGQKFGVLVFQKVAKTGNIGKKSQVAGDIDYVRYLSMQMVKNTKFVKKYFFRTKLLHAHLPYVCNLSAKH